MGPGTMVGVLWLMAMSPGDFADDRACGLEPPEVALQAPPIPAKRGQRGTPFDGSGPFVQRSVVGVDGPVAGALANKTVYLSAGHGLTWVSSLGDWRTQRGNTNDIVEDLVSIEAVNQYLIPYLHAMGAYVVTVREPDLRTEMIIVDDAEAIVEGMPQEAPVGDAGWGQVALPMTSDSILPFQSGGARALVASAEPTGALVYAPSIEVSGEYAVYVSYVQGDDRASDAHYTVRHSGGATDFRIDQRRHGSTWVLLGKFHFEAGASADRAAVVVHDDSADVGAIVSSDAVRFGGGSAVHDRGGGTNGRPMYEQAARYYTQWNGAPASVFAAVANDGDADVGARSRFAAWEHEVGEDAVYLAWHSNAPNPRVGTSSYTYGGGPPPGPLSSFSGVEGSRELQDFVHFEIVDDLRATWDPSWADEGRFTAYFGEVNPNHNPEMPAVLVEVAYHDTPSDADALRDPIFRRTVARAMAHGIARYFADKDGTPLVLPPEPPTAVWITNDGDGALRVGWLAPDDDPAAGDPPTGYLVQVSTNGYGFDDGTAVAEAPLVLDGLAPGDVRFVRVVATNDGGRSLPSHTVGAAVAPSGEASVLVAGAFDRIDGALLPDEDLSVFSLGIVDRMWLHRINDGSYAVRHGEAIAAAGLSFDGATDDAIESGVIALDGYQAVDWFAGEDSVGNEPLAAVSRDALSDYLDGGGRLLLSGAEIGWALDEYGTPDEKAFFNERLHARYALDDAETYEVAAVAGPLQDVPPLSFFDPTTYDPRYPDVLEPTSGGSVALAYADTADMGASVAWGLGEPGERGVVLGFPFETIATAEHRAALMAAVLDFFEVEEQPDDTDPDTGGGTSGGGTGSGTGSDDTGTDGGTNADGDGDGCGCRTRSHGNAGYLLLGLGLIVGRRGRGRSARGGTGPCP